MKGLTFKVVEAGLKTREHFDFLLKRFPDVKREVFFGNNSTTKLVEVRDMAGTLIAVRTYKFLFDHPIRTIRLTYFAINNNYRGTGIGKAIITMLENEYDPNSIHARVRSTNTGSIKSLFNSGFHFTENKEDETYPDGERKLSMIKVLP